MKHSLKIRLLFCLLCFTSVICADNCTQTLVNCQQLCEKQQYNQAIASLSQADCKSYEYYNLLLNAYLQTEQYAQVRQCTEDYLRNNNQPNATYAIVHYYKGLALLKLSLFDDALQAITISVQTWKNKQSAEYAMTCNAMGNVLEKLNRHNEAIEAYKNALKIYESFPNSEQTNLSLITTLGNLAQAYLAVNQNEKALSYYKKAETIYQKSPQSTLHHYLVIANNMGEYYNKKELYPQAVTYFKKVADTKREKMSSQHSSYALSLLNIITALYNAEQYTETTPYIQEYLRILRSMLQRNFTIMTEQERENYWNAQAQILDNLLVSATYASLSNKQADASLIYDICLLSKSLLLDTNIYLEKQQASGLENQMKQLHITWQDVQKQLTKQDIAVEFVCLGSGATTEYAIVLLRHNWKFPKVYYLNGLAETLDARQISRLQMHDNAIFGKLVWEPVLKEAKADDRIYFSAAGELQLMALEYFSINGDVKMYDRFEMHRLSSTKQLLQPQQPFKPQSVALLGGMDYNASAEEIAYYMAEYKQDNLPTLATPNNQNNTIWSPLPGSLREVQAINNLLTDKGIPTFLATHDAATEAALYAVANKQYDILHIATHGYYAENDDFAMQSSGLVMAGANTLQLNANPTLGTGILTSNRIAKLNLRNTQLAILSACQTGVGKITTEGVFGLQRALKMTGVKSMMVSLWEVNDAVTATLMTTFYKALLAGYDTYNAYIIATDTIRQTTFRINGKEVSGDNIALYGAFVLID